LSPELLPLLAQDVADVGQRGHVVSRTAEDDGRKFEAVDRQDVGPERGQHGGLLPGQVDGGRAVDGQAGGPDHDDAPQQSVQASSSVTNEAETNLICGGNSN